MTRLSELYDQMRQLPHGENTYRVSRYSENVFIGLDCNNKPNVFVGDGAKNRRYALETSNISIEFSREYNLVFSEGNTERLIGHRISCNSQREADIRTFLSVIQSLSLIHI